ncbi:MAG TPA: PQQ-binding-like beta-propeller repeat protein [Planctomycetaceae bacterium]|jgi:outer membrane protein assembly factor BamB
MACLLFLALTGCSETRRAGDDDESVSAAAARIDPPQTSGQQAADQTPAVITNEPAREIVQSQTITNSPLIVDDKADSPATNATPDSATESKSASPNAGSIDKAETSSTAPAVSPSPDAPPQPSKNDLPPDRSRDWPQFRGADGQGHGSASGLPLRWNEKKNIAWKVPIRGNGWSSPVIVDNKIWLTTAIVPEKSLRVLCLDATTGATLHDVEVFHKDSLGGIHPKNSHASPTPVLVDDRCYVHFGSHGTAALNLNAEIVWKTEIKYYHHHGPGGSPVIVGGAAIIACDGFTSSFYDEQKIAGVTDPQFVVALDTATGDVRWRRKRDGAHSYASPLVIDVEGQTQVISPGGNRVVAYDPSTGEELWSCRYQGYSLVPRPVSGHGLVFICTGYDVPTLLAIRTNGRGDVTDTHVAWKTNQAVPLNPSPILVGDELYTVSDQGVASCLDAKTGKLHWRKRLGGNHSTSPLFADGRLYILDEVGTTHILSPGTKCKILAKNLLRGKTLASLAASGRALYLRSDNHLYRIEATDAKPADEGDVKPGADEDPTPAESEPQ